MKRMLTVLAAVIFTAGVIEIRAAELIVDKSGATGSYTSIQEAVNNAKDGDTVTVMPGEYDNGFATYDWTDAKGVSHTLTNRVFVSKRIYLHSAEGAAVTSIVGAHDQSVPADYYGIGVAAIRCVEVDNEARGTIIQGFTFKDGCAHAYKYSDGTTVADVPASTGGGVRAGGDKSVYVLDCVFENCASTRGGALRCGTAIRCRFRGNMHGACRDSMTVNCLFDNNCGTVAMSCDSYNCTFCNNGKNGDTVFSGTPKIVNSVVVGNVGDIVPSSGNTGTRILKRSVFARLNVENYFTERDETSVTDAGDYQVFAPLCGDFQLVSDSKAVGIGDAEELSKLAISVNVLAQHRSLIDYCKDITGAPISPAGKINAGCHQATKIPAGGAVQFVASVHVDGFDYFANADRGLWMFSEEDAHVVRIYPAKDELIFRWLRTGTGETIWPEMDEAICCALPLKGVVDVFSFELPAKVAFVGASRDYTTIQDAVSGPEVLDGTLILVDSGEYADGGVVDSNNANSRVVINKNVRIKGAGAGLSTIKGAPHDPTAEDGRGVNAYRCLRFTEAMKEGCVQGFTLCNGYVNNGTDNVNKNIGGIVCAINERHSVVDCILEEGHAFRSAAAFNAKLVRCVVRRCPVMNGTIMRPGTMCNCLVYDCPMAQSGASLLEATLVGCTIVATETGIGTITANNCILSGSGVGSVTLNDGSSGNLAWDITIGGGDGYIVGNPYFVNAENDDYRLMSLSAAVSSSDLNEYWKRPQSDVFGNTPIYVGGRMLGGSVQTCVEAVEFNIPAGADADCTFSQKSGEKVLGPGESFTVTATPVEGSPREMRGYDVNGEEIVGSLTWTYTAPLDGSWTPGGISVRPLITSDWYVSPTGNDAANGWSAETAMRTLAHVMTITRAGDTVHAQPGVYQEGSTNANFASMVTGKGSMTLSRTVVPSGVTLVGDAGAANTVILGSSTASGTDYGCGSGAARCVTVMSGGTIKGFTLAGGRSGVASNITTENDDRHGAGVLAPKGDKTAVISDCIISNNVSARGAGVAGGYVKNCIVTENRAVQTSGGMEFAYATGSSFAHNYCGSGQVMRYCYDLNNCTIVGNVDLSGNGVDNCIADGSGILNASVVLDANSKACSSKNSVFVKNWYVQGATWENPVILEDVDAAKVDEYGRPQIDSPLVDSLAANLLADDLPERDFFGVRRYYNGKPDYGAFEYDWRPVYKNSLGKGKFSVEADPQIVQAENGVLIREGEFSIDIVGAPVGRNNRYAIGAEVTGDGVLTILTNGVMLTKITSADGVQTVKFRSQLAENEIRLLYVRGRTDDDSVGAHVTSVDTMQKGLLLVVR